MTRGRAWATDDQAQLLAMRGRGLAFAEIGPILARSPEACKGYYLRLLRYRRDYGRYPDAGELYSGDNKARYFKPADDDDDALLPPPAPDDGYRAPHRRIYDRLPPSSAELTAARRKEWGN